MAKTKSERYKEWLAKNPDYHKEWKRRNYQKNREKVLAQNREYRLRKIGVIAPRERARAVLRRDYTKEWRQRNPEHVRQKRREYVAKNREKIRALIRKCQLKAYGLTNEDYDKMACRQKNKCAICRREVGEGNRLVVDHDHDNSMVRQLLCHSCNRGIGLLGDDPERVASALRYLRYWRKKHALAAKEE